MSKFNLKLIAFTRDLLNVFVSHEMIHGSKIRSLEIELRYNELLLNGMRAKDARYKVADEFFRSEKSIQSIIYKKTNIHSLKSRHNDISN